MKFSTLILTTIGVASFGACAPAPQTNTPPPPTQITPTPGSSDVSIAFEGTFDPSNGSFTIKPVTGVTGSGLEPVNIVQDGNTGTGPANSVELVTTNVRFDATGVPPPVGCGAPNTFCADVEVRSFYGTPLINTFVELTGIQPAAGHLAVNDDAPPMDSGLNSGFGLWGYGTLNAMMPASTRLWVFGDDGTAFRVAGRVMADFARGPRGTAIAVNPQGNTLAVANLRTNDITLFNRNTMVQRARVPSGGVEPVSVSWAPDRSTLYVVNRFSQNVVRFNNANTANPTPSGTVAVGSEPGLASLAPNGTRLFVPNMVDGTVSVIDTGSFTVANTVALGDAAPYATCMTNDGDGDDTDESLFVTDFYSRTNPGERETEDDARHGEVHRIATGGLGVTTFDLSPFPNVFAFNPAGGAFPNQLFSCVVNSGRVYVTAVGASPAALPAMVGPNPTDFRQNIQGLVSVLDATTGAEDLGRRVNINSLVPGMGPRRFMSTPTGIDFVGGTNRAVVISRNSDAAFRVSWETGVAVRDFPATATPFLDTRGAPQMGRPNIQSPQGITIYGSHAYVYNEVFQSVAVFDLNRNTRVFHVQTSPLPALGSPEERARVGLAFFDTALGRWSAEGWVGCAGCHPMGQTDNVTWSFGAGPRQTIDISASFDDLGNQRVLNYTAIFDEFADFEANTRGVSNGVGAIVHTISNPPVNADRIDLAAQTPPQTGNIGSALDTSFGAPQPQFGLLQDWQEITEWAATIRASRGKTANLGGDPANGRNVFIAGGCQNCHGGNAWTLSQRYNTPARDQNCNNVTLAAVGVASTGLVPPPQLNGRDQTTLRVVGNEFTAGAPNGQDCVKRVVGTFNNFGPSGQGGVEVRQNGTAAQGTDGYNVPSLLNIGLSAPFYHNGSAETLEEAFGPSFNTHLTAGNAGFAPGVLDMADLIAFVETIDDDTAPIAIPAGFDFCPGELTQNPCAP